MKKIILNTIRNRSSNYKKFYALVDDEDYEKVKQFNWHVLKIRDLLYAKTNGGKIFMHKFITGFKQTDHIDGNGLNNQKSNLREVTTWQNLANQKIHKNNSSGYKGVYWNKRSRKWQVCIGGNEKRLHGGLFKDKEKAALAYNKKAKELFGEFARLNVL